MYFNESIVMFMQASQKFWLDEHEHSGLHGIQKKYYKYRPYKHLVQMELFALYSMQLSEAVGWPIEGIISVETSAMIMRIFIIIIF